MKESIATYLWYYLQSGNWYEDFFLGARWQVTFLS
jgi:hypothetical protein